MTQAEREELAQAVYDLLAATDAVEASGVLRVLGGRLTDNLRMAAWLVKRLDVAAALREPVGEAHPVNPNVVSVAADMLRDVAADLDRAVRASGVSQAGVAGSDPPSGVFLPGQSQPASAVPVRKRLPCGCEDSARTMSTMVRGGRFGWGHYAQDGDFMGECVSPPKLIAEIDALRAENATLRERADTYKLVLDAVLSELPTPCPYGEMPGHVAELRTRAERAEAEVALMRPVVEAALAWGANSSSSGDSFWQRLHNLANALYAYHAAKGKP